MELKITFTAEDCENTIMNKPRRILFFQPALPAYRVDFFDRTAKLLGGNFEMYYSPLDMGVLTEGQDDFEWAKPLGTMKELPMLSYWQIGAMSVPFTRNDIVVVSGAPRCLTNILLLIKARLKGTPTVWFGHYWSSTTAQHRFFLRMLLMKLANTVLFYTDREIEEYREGIGKSDKRHIAALNNGIDNTDIKRLRKSYVAAERPKSLLFIGRLFEKCELETLLEAMADPRLIDFQLQVIGDGPATPNMKKLAVKLGVQDRIIWHGGTTDENKIAEIANQCRLFAFPGAVGLSLIHAMGYGLPAIINDNRWTNGPEITAFSDGETGRSFRQGSIVDMATKIAEVIDASLDLDQWSNEARRRTDTSFNTKVMAERMVALIDHIQSAKPHSRAIA
jgi:glycosyltransferase involved in cell wall biosynthesis